MELTEEILKERYRNFVWLFLEKITYFLIAALREINENLKIEGTKQQVEIKNPSTKITSSKTSVKEISESSAIKAICKALESYQKLLSCEIPLNNSSITHSKIQEESIKSLKSNLSHLGISFNTKIQQEWGGGSWMIHFYTDKNDNEYIYCEEVGSLRMTFLFKKSNKQQF